MLLQHFLGVKNDVQSTIVNKLVKFNCVLYRDKFHKVSHCEAVTEPRDILALPVM